MNNETGHPDGAPADAGGRPRTSRSTETRRAPAAMRRRRIKLLRRVLRNFVAGRFGWVFAIGVAMITGWAAILILLGFEDPLTSKALFKMTITQIPTGRASAIAVGKELHLATPTLIFAASYIDITIVMTLFPLIAYGYRNLARLGLFGDFAREAVDAAEGSRPAVAKWGMLGLFFFVVFPLLGTGPLIGSVIGFFIGLPLLLNLFVVISGTIAAIIAWVYVFEWIYSKLQGFGGELGHIMPLMLVVVIVGVAILLRVRSVMKTRNHTDSGIIPAVDAPVPGALEAGSEDAPPDGPAAPAAGPDEKEGS